MNTQTCFQFSYPDGPVQANPFGNLAGISRMCSSYDEGSIRIYSGEICRVSQIEPSRLAHDRWSTFDLIRSLPCTICATRTGTEWLAAVGVYPPRDRDWIQAVPICPSCRLGTNARTLLHSMVCGCGFTA